MRSLFPGNLPSCVGPLTPAHPQLRPVIGRRNLRPKPPQSKPARCPPQAERLEPLDAAGLDQRLQPQEQCLRASLRMPSLPEGQTSPLMRSRGIKQSGATIEAWFRLALRPSLDQGSPDRQNLHGLTSPRSWGSACEMDEDINGGRCQPLAKLWRWAPARGFPHNGCGRSSMAWR